MTKGTGGEDDGGGHLPVWHQRNRRGLSGRHHAPRAEHRHGGSGGRAVLHGSRLPCTDRRAAVPSDGPGARAARVGCQLKALWLYLLFGPDELVLPKSWLKDRDRLRAYTGYTKRQLQQGCVVSDVAAMRQRAFWEAWEAKQAAKHTATVTPFRIVKG